MNYNLQYVSPTLREIINPASKKSHFFKKNLSFRSYSKAFVAPYVNWDKSIGCVLDSKGTVIHDAQCVEWKENGDYYDIRDAEVKHKTVIFLGFLLAGFGHAFIDNLRKIWFLRTEEFRTLMKQGAEVVYTTSWNAKLPESVIEVFAMSGVDIKKARKIEKLIQFDQVIIPDSCVVAKEFGRVYNHDFVRIIDNIKDNCNKAQEDTLYDKIYFTRTKIKSWRDTGEKRIEHHFRKLGYTIISPEHYPISTQIKMMQNCSFFAATEGSVSHLSLFCRPGTKVFIVNKANYLNFHQLLVNEFADLDVTYIEAHHSSRSDKAHPWWGPFFLYTTKYCKQFFKRHVISLPYWLLPDYWYYFIYFSPFAERIKDWVRSRRKGILD